MEQKEREIIKIYPYCAIKAPDSSYRIVRLNVVTKRFEVLNDIFKIEADCKNEVEKLNAESGSVDFLLEEEV